MDRSFLRHAATYGLATVLVQAGGFVLLPIYLRCLSPADYGVLEIVGRLAETVGTLLLLGGFRQALFTFYQQAQDEDERRRVVAGAFVLVVAAGAVGAGVLAAAAPWLAAWFGSTWLLHLAVVGILLEPLSLLPLTLIQARTESGVYVVVVVAQFLFRVVLCILLVRVLRWGVPGALAATAITGAVFGLVLSGRELARGVAWPRAEQLRAMAAFALPLLPGGACFFVLHHGDRFFLLRHATTEEIGTYALGYKLAMVVRLVSLVPLYMVWSSRMYAAAREPDAPVVFGRVFTRILAVYLFAGLGLCLFAREVVELLGGKDYAAAAAVVAPVALACFLQAGATLMDSAFFVRRRTGAKLAVTAAATVVMLALYALLIPPFGAMGAALATAGGFAFLAAATWRVTQAVFPVRYEWGRLGCLLALSAALYAIGSALPTSAAGLMARAAILAAALPLAWWSGLVPIEEKRYLRDLVRQLTARRQPEGLTA